jgi:hypothetical protein
MPAKTRLRQRLCWHRFSHNVPFYYAAMRWPPDFIVVCEKCGKEFTMAQYRKRVPHAR